MMIFNHLYIFDWKTYKKLCVFIFIFLILNHIKECVCVQCFVSFWLKKHINECVFSMFLGCQPNPPEIGTFFYLFLCELGWHPKNIENTQSFIYFFNQKDKQYWKCTDFLYDLSTPKMQKIENTQSFIWISNQKDTKDWKHTVFHMFFNRKYKNDWNTLFFSYFSIDKSEHIEYIM